MTKSLERNRRPRLLPCYAPIILQLKKVRVEKGISQFDLEYTIGIARGYLSKWECGIRTPSFFGFVCWAKALDLDVEFTSSLPSPANDNSRLVANDNSQDGFKTREFSYSHF